MGHRSDNSGKRKQLLVLGLVGGAAATLSLWHGAPDHAALTTAAGAPIAPLWKRTPVVPAAAPQPPDPLVGDAALRGEIDLDKSRVQGDAVVVPLGRGRRATLTLDPKIQEAARRTLARSQAHEAAAVVMSLDGRILALAGYRKANPAKPDYSLPVSVWAPAASVFKLVTSTALLEAGVRPSTEVCYRGGLRSVEAANLKPGRRPGSDCRDFRYGLAKSQNAIIAKLTHLHLHRKDLTDAARRLGFNVAPDFGLEAEKSHCEIPSGGLELARVAAGFWSSELSPLGGALLAGTIASGGLSLTPRIVSSVQSPAGTQPVLPVPQKRVVSARVAHQLAEMMTATCDMGTAYRGFHDRRGRPFFDAKIAGKTGSLSVDKPAYRAYSWFVGFAPADDPQVVIAVLLANPEKWVLKAHTAARLILQSVI